MRLFQVQNTGPVHWSLKPMQLASVITPQLLASARALWGLPQWAIAGPGAVARAAGGARRPHDGWAIIWMGSTAQTREGQRIDFRF